MYPKTLGTIGSYIDDGYTITAFCDENGCHHSRKLDLEALAAKLGREFDMIDKHDRLVAMLRCEKCGKKGNISLSISPPTGVGAGAYWRKEEQ